MATPNKDRTKRQISGEARSNSTEEPMSPETTGQNSDSNVLTALKDELMAAVLAKMSTWARDITADVPISLEKKTPISREARENSNEKPTSPVTTGHISGAQQIPGKPVEAARENTGGEGKRAEGIPMKPIVQKGNVGLGHHNAELNDFIMITTDEMTKKEEDYVQEIEKLRDENETLRQALLFEAPVQKENARLRLYNAELNDLILATTDEMAKREKYFGQEIEKLRHENETLLQAHSEVTSPDPLGINLKMQSKPLLPPKPKGVRPKPQVPGKIFRDNSFETDLEQLRMEHAALTKELQEIKAESPMDIASVDELHNERERFFWDEEQVQLRAERDLASKATMELKDKEQQSQEEIKRVQRNWQFTYDTLKEETTRLMDANDKLKKYIQSNLAGDTSLDENMDVSETLQKVLIEKETLQKDIESLKQELSSKLDSLQSATQKKANLEKCLIEAKSELSSKVDSLQLANQEKANLEKCLIEAKSEVQVKSESYDMVVGENAYLKQRLETVIKDMLEKIEGAQADILNKLRTELEDSNKGMRLEIAQLRQNNEHMQMYISVAKKGVISFSVLHHVAQNITGDWFMLGRELDFENSTLIHIDHDMRALKDKAFKVLMTWYERAPEAATKDKLLYALRELRRKDIADDIADME